MGDAVIVIGDDKKRSWGTVLIVVGVAVVIALLALLLYHPTGAAYLVITIYNPSNQSTANPHVQPITMSCSFLQELWNKTIGHAPTCQDIAYNVTFIEDNQVLPAYPIVSGDSITWWVKMPAIPAMSSVNVTMILGNPSSITSPQNVFLIYGNISSFQPGYIYTLNTTSGITTIYNPSGVYPFIYVANGSAWLFTPNANPSSNGFSATPIGSGYLSIAALPNGQYLVSVVQKFYAPFNTTYQPINLTGTYVITCTPQSVLDELSGLGAAYVTSLMTPPPWNGSLPQISTNPYYIQLPQCRISSNPYGGKTGTYNILNCLAINNGGVWSMIRFYYQPGEDGVILSLQNAQYSSSPSDWSPWVYIGTNGYLYVGDWAGFSAVQVSFQLAPGWHTLIVGEYYSSGTYYIVAYLDTPSNAKITTTTILPQLFGQYSSYPYGYVGVGYSGGAWPSTNQAWFFFDGVIAYVVLYPGGTSVGSPLVNNAFSIVGQTHNYVFGYAIDYPPNGVEPIIVSIHVGTPGWVPTQPVGAASYSVHVISP